MAQPHLLILPAERINTGSWTATFFLEIQLPRVRCLSRAQNGQAALGLHMSFTCHPRYEYNTDFRLTTNNNLIIIVLQNIRMARNKTS